MGSKERNVALSELSTVAKIPVINPYAKGIYQPHYKRIKKTQYKGNGNNPNSLKALAANRGKWKRCARKDCNRPAWKGAKNGFCFLCFRKYCSPRKQSQNPHALEDKNVGRYRYYRKMGPKLQAFVDECLEQPESDQFNLTQELALSRDLLDEAIGLYEAAKALPDSNPRKVPMFATASQLLATASKEVRETCRVGAEVFNNAKDKYSVHTLVEVVSQIKRMIRLCFEHDEAGLERFDEMLNDKLRLPKIGADGTTITPDSDVMQMDDSVPRIVDAVSSDAVMLLLDCPQCNQQFEHPDTNCICPQCNVPLREVAA